MKATIEVITPDTAQKWLKQNTRNRSLREAKVATYAHDMTSGNWKDNGSTIVFNGRTLIDGQHRLQACIKAGVPFRSIVVRGVSSEAIETVDTGMRRSLSDVLAINGVSVAPRRLSGAITLGQKWQRVLVSENANVIDAGRFAPSVSDHLKFFADNPGLETAVARTSRVGYLPTRWTPAVAAMLVWRADIAGIGHRADEFITGVLDGEGLNVGDPIYLLREKLLSIAASKHQRISVHLSFALTLKAWNLWMTGETREQLRFNPSGKYREAFPQMLDESGVDISPLPAES